MAFSLASLRSWSVQWGPFGHSWSKWFIVCTSPHGHSGLLANPHLWRLYLFFPTFACALFNVTQSFLVRLVPLGRVPASKEFTPQGTHWLNTSVCHLSQWSRFESWACCCCSGCLLSGRAYNPTSILPTVGKIIFCHIDQFIMCFIEKW